MLQQLHGLLAGGCLFGGRASEGKVLERLLVVEAHAVEEGVLRIDLVTEHDVAEFMRQHGGQRGLVRHHVDQAPAVNDSSVVVSRTRQWTSGWTSRSLVTSRLFTTVSSTLSTSPGGASRPMPSRRRMTFC